MTLSAINVMDMEISISTTYQFTIQIANSLSSNGYFQVTFPSTVSFASSLTCSLAVGGQYYTASSCSSNANNVVTVGSLFSATFTNTNTNLILLIQGIKNPTATDAVITFDTIKTFYSTASDNNY